jgi:hypothetical protein
MKTNLKGTTVYDRKGNEFTVTGKAGNAYSLKGLKGKKAVSAFDFITSYTVMPPYLRPKVKRRLIRLAKLIDAHVQRGDCTLDELEKALLNPK